MSSPLQVKKEKALPNKTLGRHATENMRVVLNVIKRSIGRARSIVKYGSVDARRRGSEEAKRRRGEEAGRRGGEEARRRGGEEARRRRRRGSEEARSGEAKERRGEGAGRRRSGEAKERGGEGAGRRRSGEAKEAGRRRRRGGEGAGRRRSGGSIFRPGLGGRGSGDGTDGFSGRRGGYWLKACRQQALDSAHPCITKLRITHYALRFTSHASRSPTLNISGAVGQVEPRKAKPISSTLFWARW
jgi:hypothetical protein